MPQRVARRGASVAAIVLVVTLCPTRLDAHLNSTGLGPIYDGALHLLLSPEDLVAAFAIALLAGLRGPQYGRFALFALPSAWLVGGLAALPSAPVDSTVTVVVTFLLLGTLIAADAPLSLNLVTALVVVLGVVHGYLNGAGIGPPSVAIPALMGLASALFVMIALAGAFVVRLRQPWSRIAVRVLGSWIVATGLLMFGWAAHAAGAR
jgi:urease accessory protein